MEQVLAVVKDFVVLYLLVALLMQLIGDGQINKYVRFFAGLIFLLLIMSPIYQILTDTNLEQKIRIDQLMADYNSRLQFDEILDEYSEQTVQTAVSILMDRYNETLEDKGYEIKQYDCKLNEEDQLEEVNLYIGKINSVGTGFSSVSRSASCAKECETLLKETWDPEFELRVFGKDGE